MSDNYNDSQSQTILHQRDSEEENITPSISRPQTAEATNGDVNLEDAFSKIFKSSVSGTGEEELLRIASNYSLQINAKQIKCLLFIENKARMFQALANSEETPLKIKYRYISEYLREFVVRWLELKQHNNSDVFVMRALDSISLRKFINENTLKVNIEK